MEPTVGTKLSTSKQAEVKTQLAKWHTDAEEGNRGAFGRMSRCERFKIGRQWSGEDLEWNRARRKHSITINRCLPAVLQLDGYEIQNPRDISIKPTKSGTDLRARILMAIIKDILDRCQAQRGSSRAFDDGLTTGRGYLMARRNYDRDPKGDWEVVQLDPFCVLRDPAMTAYDPNAASGGARYFIVDEWLPKELIHKRYPQKKAEIGDADYGKGDGLGDRIMGLVSRLFGSEPEWDQRDSYRTGEDGGVPTPAWKYENNYCCRTTWWRTWEEGVYVQRLDEPAWYVTLWKPDDIDKAKRLLHETRKKNIRIIESTNGNNPVVVPVLHWALMIGDVLVDYEDDPFGGVSRFPVFPFSPYYQHGYEFGVVENLIGPQKVVNSSWSRALDLIKHLANVGWRVTKATAAMRRWLELHGTEDGIVIDEGDFGGRVEKIEPNAYPAGFAEITDKSTEHINQIANVRLEDPTWDEKSMSGRAIALKQEATMTGSAMLFANYDHTKEMLGNFFVEAVLYSGCVDDAEIRDLVGDEELLDPKMLAESRELLMRQWLGEVLVPPEAPDPVMVQRMDPESQMRWWMRYRRQEQLYTEMLEAIDQEARPMAVARVLDEFHNIGRGRYGVKVGLSQSASTHRAQQFLELMELHKVLIESQMPGIPREVLIKMSDVAHKDEILAAAPAA